MPENTKVATFSSELLRRLRMTNTGLSRNTNEGILMDYMDNMEGMGYSTTWRTKVLRSTMIGYCRILGKIESGEMQRNRKGAATMMNRRFKSLVGSKD